MGLAFCLEYFRKLFYVEAQKLASFGLPSVNAKFNPFPNKPWFLRVCSISLLKTL